MKLSIKNLLSTLFIIIQLGAGNIVFAAVEQPRLVLTTLADDIGASVSAVDGSMVVDLTAISLVGGDGNIIDIPDVDFKLTAQYSGAGISPDSYIFTNGLISAGSVLNAQFAYMELTLLPTNTAVFWADLDYTGGDLTGDLTAGRIEGVAFNINGAIDTGFTAADVQASLGPVVVPLPAAIWLFLSSIITLFGFSCCKRNHV